MRRTYLHKIPKPERGIANFLILFGAITAIPTLNNNKIAKFPPIYNPAEFEGSPNDIS